MAKTPNKEITTSAASIPSEPVAAPVPVRTTHASRTRLIILIILLLLGTWLGAAYWHYSSQYLSTDDAFINADQVQIGTEVSGQITLAPLKNNSYVKKGTLLFALDATPFQAAVHAAQAGIAAAERAQHTAQAAVVTAEAVLQQQRANAQSAHDHLQRLLKMRDRQFVSAQDLDDARSANAVAQAAVKAAQAALAQAKTAVGIAGPNNDRIKSAEAQLAQAVYALSKTQVRAPMDGRLANYAVETGQPVAANQPLFSIVATHHLWVDANFKETDLSSIHVGAPALITSDIYAHHQFKGTVLSIAAGAGTAFSLLPPQNATGNWVKVTQRVPVRIVLDASDQAERLPIGTSTATQILLTPHPLTFGESLLAVLGLPTGRHSTSDH